MAEVVCIACSTRDESVEFPNMMELKKHEMLGHTTRWEKPLPVDPRGDHPSATELKKERDKPRTEDKHKPDKPDNQTRQSEPLHLEYKYEGECPQCHDKVKTIEVDVGEHSLIVAYCVRDDKKLLQQTVIPIANQLLAKEDTFERKIKQKRKENY